MKLTYLRSRAICIVSPTKALAALEPRTVKHRATSKMTAASDDGRPTRRHQCHASHECSAGSDLHPLAVIGVDVDRHTVKDRAPLDHRGVEMRMRDNNRRQSACCFNPCHALLINKAQGNPEMLPAGPLMKKARWPIANDGEISRLCMPSASFFQITSCVRPMDLISVHCWPVSGTNCRSSSQIGQDCGGS